MRVADTYRYDNHVARFDLHAGPAVFTGGQAEFHPL